MVTTPISLNAGAVLSLEDWRLNPPESTEWVDGKLIEKSGMGLRHSRIQARLGRLWGSYLDR